MLSLIEAIAPLLIGKLSDAFVAYENKQISLAELNAKVRQALMECFTEVMKSQSDALSKTFATFGDVMKNSRLVRWVWAIITLSQLGVLLWVQVAVPWLVWMYGKSFPSAGVTIEWAYLLIVLLCGGGPVVLNAGPGKVNIDSLKPK